MARRRTPSEPPAILVPANQLVRPRRGLSEDESAGLIGVGRTNFRALVADGQMPKPIKIGRRNIWDILALHRAFNALGAANDDVEANSWHIRALDRAFDALAAANDDAETNSWDDVV